MEFHLSHCKRLSGLQGVPLHPQLPWENTICYREERSRPQNQVSLKLGNVWGSFCPGGDFATIGHLWHASLFRVYCKSPLTPSTGNETLGCLRHNLPEFLTVELCDMEKHVFHINTVSGNHRCMLPVVYQRVRESESILVFTGASKAPMGRKRKTFSIPVSSTQYSLTEGKNGSSKGEPQGIVRNA